MHKIIILILSSSGDIYSNFKFLQKEYLSLFTPLIKFYFVEFNENQTADVIESNNTLSFKGTESITPGMIIKTSLAINYLKKYEYDFLFRTNLSTVINIKNLFYLVNSLSLGELIFSGFPVFGFVTGTGILMDKNTANIIANNYMNFDYMNINEDSLISQMFSFFNINYAQMPSNFKWGLITPKLEESDKQNHIIHYLTNNKYKKFTFDKNILHFRIKNIDRNIDILFFRDIIEQLYNIKIDI